MKEFLKNNPVILFFYRFIKVLYYRIFYSTPIYKLLFPQKINDVINSDKKYTLLICHNGGGGTITYLNNKYGNQKNTLILRNTISADKDYLYSIENNETHKRFYFNPNQLSILNNYINEVKIIAVESYMSLRSLFDWLISLNVYISYDLHDFHCIWIQAHLCNSKGYLTEKQIKESKLRYLCKTIYYNKWHELWNSFFRYVNDIYAFSESSKNLFSLYFPDFSAKVKVTPHSLQYIKYNEIKTLPVEFKIGIFGAINNVDKGCLVVRDFLKYCSGKDFEIYINGSLRKDCCIHSNNINYMGPYKADSIKDIIVQQKISVVLFPSVWPETFSYLVSELIATGVPVVCFNFGAQAEKISHYSKGEVVSNINNEEILIALKKAFTKGQNYESK